VVYNLCANLRMLISVIEELSCYQVTQRLACLISRLAPVSWKAKSPRVSPKISSPPNWTPCAK
jgi:hypothetical protein